MWINPRDVSVLRLILTGEFVMDWTHYDLIVVGHSDHSELWDRLLGDPADRISDHAHCSVLIVES